MSVNIAYNWSMKMSQDVVIPIFGKKVDEEFVKRFASIPENVSWEIHAKDVITLQNTKVDRRVYLLGLGDESDKIKQTQCLRSFVNGKKCEKPRSLSIVTENLEDTTLQNVIIGAVLGVRQYGIFKTNGEKSKSNSPEIYIQMDEGRRIIAEEAMSIASAKLTAMDLVDLPSNIKTPKYLADKAVAMGDEFGFKTTTILGEALLRHNLFALYEVGKGSIHESAFIIMDYTPENVEGELKTVALVGKGITFDTGGISIKPSSNLAYMKSDMGGAAAVIGAMQLIAHRKLPIRVVGIVPSAENAVDGNAYKPGDVINSYSGKTIEVIDTDAEGRVVLADGLSYAIKNYTPDHVIDLATLTGNCILALGYLASGLFTKADALATVLQAASDACDERVWKLPMWDDYHIDMQSDIADIKNLSARPVAGAITAAKFLETFTNEHPSWAHLDIAGVAFGDSEYAKSRTATGFGVRLLYEAMKIIHK